MSEQPKRDGQDLVVERICEPDEVWMRRLLELLLDDNDQDSLGSGEPRS